jgi:flagellar export protein FliJ
MAKKRSQRMGVVHKVAQLDEQRAADALNAVRAQLQQAQQQLEDFQNYRTEYLRNSPQQQAGSRVNARDLVNFTGFMAQLDDVIDRQREAVARIEEQYQRAVQIWQQKQRYQKKIAELRDKAFEKEQFALEKKLQAQIDDASARKLREKHESDGGW